MIVHSVELAACRCLQRLVERNEIPDGVRLGGLLAKHTRPDRGAPDRVWHIRWESVLAEVIVATARRRRRHSSRSPEAGASQVQLGT